MLLTSPGGQTDTADKEVHNDLQRVQTLQEMPREVKGDTLQGFCD